MRSPGGPREVHGRSMGGPREVQGLRAVCDRKSGSGSGSGSGRSGRFFQIRFRSGSGQIPTGSTGFD